MAAAVPAWPEWRRASDAWRQNPLPQCHPAHGYCSRALRLPSSSSEALDHQVDSRGTCRARSPLAATARDGSSEQRARIAPRTVTTRGAIVGHEERIAHKRNGGLFRSTGIFHHVGHTCGRMAGRVHGAELQRPQHEAFIVIKEMVKLPPIVRKALARIKQEARDVLHGADVRADTCAAAQAITCISRIHRTRAPSSRTRAAMRSAPACEVRPDLRS